MAIALVVNDHTLTPEAFNKPVGVVVLEGNLGVYVVGGIAIAVGDVNAALATFDTATKRISGRLSSITAVMCSSDDVTGWAFAWDKSAGKIKAWSTPGTEATAIDLSTKTFQLTVYGARA